MSNSQILKAARELKKRADDAGGFETNQGMEIMSNFEADLENASSTIRKWKFKAWVLVMEEADEKGENGNQDKQFRHEANLWIWRATNHVATYFLELPVGTKVDQHMMWRLSLIVEEWNFISLEKLHEELQLHDARRCKRTVYGKKMWEEVGNDDDAEDDEENAGASVGPQKSKYILGRSEALKRYMGWFKKNEVKNKSDTWNEARLRRLRYNLYQVIRAERKVQAQEAADAEAFFAKQKARTHEAADNQAVLDQGAADRAVDGEALAEEAADRAAEDNQSRLEDPVSNMQQQPVTQGSGNRASNLLDSMMEEMDLMRPIIHSEDNEELYGQVEGGEKGSLELAEENGQDGDEDQNQKAKSGSEIESRSTNDSEDEDIAVRNPARKPSRFSNAIVEKGSDGEENDDVDVDAVIPATLKVPKPIKSYREMRK